MKLSDEKVIEFLGNSPIRSFQSMLDSLRYLDSVSIEADSEYELFDWGLGDNPSERIEIMVPTNRGIPANALFAFMQHAHLARRLLDIGKWLATGNVAPAPVSLAPRGGNRAAVPVLAALPESHD